MSWMRDVADRTAGALQGARDAARGIEYEPRTPGSSTEPTAREQAVYTRWQAGEPPRNAYERDAFTSIPSELAAEMDRVEEMAAEAEADRRAEAEAAERDDWNAFLEREQEGRADLEAGS
jgi:hypothetical protein